MNGRLRSYLKHIKLTTKNKFENEMAPASVKAALLSENLYKIELVRHKSLTDSVIEF